MATPGARRSSKPCKVARPIWESETPGDSTKLLFRRLIASCTSPSERASTCFRGVSFGGGVAAAVLPDVPLVEGRVPVVIAEPETDGDADGVAEGVISGGTVFPPGGVA